ncbi:MAG: VWA domain-containing protein [Verrucomicrobiota bacterium]
MSFLYPLVLLLIPVLLLLLFVKVKRSALTVPSLISWSNRNRGRARFLWLPVAMRRSVLVLIVVAVARPQTDSSYSLEVNEGIAIQLLIDVSSSMDAQVSDTGGKTRSRMEVAKEMVERFIAGDGETLEGRPNDLIGLITFARYADTRSPLTFGHDALLQIVRSLDVQERPNEDGTAYGDALAVAAARLQNIKDPRFGAAVMQLDDIKSRVIILLTDGENNSGAHLPLEAAGLAKQWGCRIYCISLTDTTFQNTNESALEELSPAEQTLKLIGEQTGGNFWQADGYESLLSIYEEIDRLERSKISSRSYPRKAEWFWLPVALAIFSLLGALSLEATVLRVVP